ncbi:Biopolymer transport protein ExbD [Paracoccus halophilus]|uniref:Biopolymer transport protein ExbD n=1 Tax=Paracoccus halophilus TaxID=376733 RepID=A0A1I0TLW2_9RHOB|nr:biopolymer transporter ExbD [Paracoccus halophilus]SFA51986.1 Biopolymer transport protein ExbD [Paracoccus halophilus]
MQAAQSLMRQPGLDLPMRRRRAVRFSMTALADVLFQLLIFFMLSSNLAAYSLLPLRSGALQGEGGAGTAPAAGAKVVAAQNTAIWTLNVDGITAAGQRFGIDRLAGLADALAAQDTRHVLIILRPEVPVQDVVTVLEALAARGIGSVQIAEAPASPASPAGTAP